MLDSDWLRARDTRVEKKLNRDQLGATILCRVKTTAKYVDRFLKKTAYGRRNPPSLLDSL